jgi:phosphoglycolate phosphatase
MKHIIFDCDGTLVDTSGYKARLFPGIKELLADLSAQHTLYVWTARGRDSTLRILKDLQVAQYFNAFATPDDCVPKPHIQGILQLVGSTSKKSVCVIGDSSNDILGAKNFGAIAIGAIWNNETNGDVLKDYGADFIVSHPRECSRIIELNLKGDDDV